MIATELDQKLSEQVSIERFKKFLDIPLVIEDEISDMARTLIPEITKAWVNGYLIENEATRAYFRAVHGQEPMTPTAFILLHPEYHQGLMQSYLETLLDVIRTGAKLKAMKG